MYKSTVLATTVAIFIFLPAPANAHWRPDSGCEGRLEQHLAVENLVDEAADFEGKLSDLESLCRGSRCLREAQALRADFAAYVDGLLERRAAVADFATIMMRETLLRARAMRAPLLVPISAGPTILGFADDPRKLPSGLPVAVGNVSSAIQNVTFASELLLDFWGLAFHLQAKFLRAIFKGIVGPVNENGVKPLKEYHPDLVEVKIHGAERLFGCLKNGKLTLMRLAVKHVSENASLAKYGSLCD